MCIEYPGDYQSSHITWKYGLKISPWIFLGGKYPTGFIGASFRQYDITVVAGLGLAMCGSRHNWIHNGMRPDSRDQTSGQCWLDVGPASQTLAQHEVNNGSMYSRFSLDETIYENRVPKLKYRIDSFSYPNPSKRETLTQWWFNVGPLSTTLDEH